MLSTKNSEIRVRTILDSSNLNEFAAHMKREHAPKAAYLLELFSNLKVTEVKVPKITDMIELADGTLTTTPRFETSINSAGDTVLTAGGIKSLESANQKYADLVERRRQLNATVLLDIQYHISDSSLLKIQSHLVGTYDDVSSDLLRFWPAVMQSHSKSDPVSLMEAVTLFFKTSMTLADNDFYQFTQLLTERKRILELKFAAYMDRGGHVAKLLDTLFVLQLALGINKRPEYTSSLEKLRSLDLSKPSQVALFPTMLESFTSATVSATVLQSFEAPYLGAAAKGKNSKKPVADSSETTKVQCNCEECNARFDVVKNFKTGLPFKICKKCYQAKLLLRKQKEDAAKNAGAAKRGGPIPQKTPVNRATGNSSVSAPTLEVPGSLEYLESYSDIYTEDEDAL